MRVQIGGVDEDHFSASMLIHVPLLLVATVSAPPLV